jgi:hypothetical protein
VGGLRVRARRVCYLRPSQLFSRLLTQLEGENVRQWPKWAMIFQGLHCVNTFYHFAPDGRTGLGDPLPQGALSGLLSLSWCKEDELVVLVRALLDAGANVNARRPDGATPLFCAVQYASVVTLNEFIQRGADVNATDSLGRSALFGLGGDGGDIFTDMMSIRALARSHLSISTLDQYVG